MENTIFSRRAFLAASAVLVAPRVSFATPSTLRNWAGNIAYSHARFHEPRSISEIRAIVRSSGKVKPLGTRHSFSTIADTTGDLVSLANFRKIVSFDQSGQRVIVEPGVRYGDLSNFLTTKGFAVRNMASLPHISVGGSVATGTHGSGDRNGNLSTHVTELEIVTGCGDVMHLSRENSPEMFTGAVVGLGALGIVTRLTLEVVPEFEVAQRVYENLSHSALEASFDEIFGAGYSVSLFTTWADPIEEVWVKALSSEDRQRGDLFGATPAPTDLHPIRELSSEPCTPQMGVSGPSFERLPHFKMGFTPSKGEELQSEYFVARENGMAAIKAVHAIRDLVAPVLFISEVRTMKGDDLWMSPAYGRDTVSLHFTWKPNQVGVERVLPQLEAALRPFGARPHWGKRFHMGAMQIAALYPKFEEFRKLARRFDPQGKFRNAFLSRNVFGC